jgi:hypothetical protein
MTLEEKIISSIHELPETKKAEVLDFVEFLRSKTEEREWSALSLSSAMRGIAEEAAPYSLSDLKESST